MSAPVPPELEEVANQIGEFIEYWGFKNVHGRLWVHVFLASEPLDAGELISRLGVSKALISMSIADLLEHDVIRIAGKTFRGTVTYRSNTNLTDVIRNILRKRERRLLSRVSSAVRLLDALPGSTTKSDMDELKLSGERIESLRTMVSTAESCLDAMLELGPATFETFRDFRELQDS